MILEITYGGYAFESASGLIRTNHPNECYIEEVLSDGMVLDCDIYCVSIIYNRFLDLDHWGMERVANLMGYIEKGRDEGFWLSFYQSADLHERIGRSRFAGLCDFENEVCPVEMLKLATEKFNQLPPEVSLLTLQDIKKKLDIMTFKAQGSVDVVV
jgi:hypothetical protein